MNALTPLILTAALLGGASLPAQADNKTFSSEDIFALEYASDPQISPDGKHIVYVRRGYDIMKDNNKQSLWLYSLSTDEHTPLFADQYSYAQPRWSPDGTRIAFTSSRSGSLQVHMHWLAQDKTALLSQLPKPVRDLTWSPDGTQLAFTMTVPQGPSDFVKSVKLPKKPKGADWSKPVTVIDKARYQADGQGFLTPSFRHVFVLPAEGGAPRQLTQGDYQHYGPLAWSPDATQVVYASDKHPDWEYRTTELDLYGVGVGTYSTTQLTDLPGRETHPQFSHDAQQLAFLSRGNAAIPYVNTELSLLNLKSGAVKSLTSALDRAVGHYQWAGKGDFVIQYDDRGQRKLATLTHAGNITERVSSVAGTSIGRPYVSGEFSMANNGALAFTQGSAERPADLGYFHRNKQRTLTALNEDLLGHKTLGQVHELTVESQFDREPIHGWYITPPDFDTTKQYPLLVEIHGGPHLAYGPSFSAELQRYAAAGYVVVYMNYRGSTSYGKDFALLLDGKYSSKEDFADHNSAVDALIAKGFIDKNNLFIAGGSAGGIAAAYAIGLSDRFNAAAITKPVINWVSKVLTADSYLGQIRNQFPGMPWDNLSHYWQRSPLSLVGNVTTPAMIMTGEQDRRTPISESEQFYQALKLQKVDTVLIRVPGSAHGIAGRPSRMIAKIEHTLAWFERYRK
ncbi:prolyl oligopeptidase family serine peptidase [Pseudoalteromonas ruthenica]|uniref:S9 family peptidase n=1 Tax=Pseudoalteromonas ruthenica TaxID=151081 RepID=UPI00034A4195|nr:S9 family peptidase [Pseudoalteromonas ruthenica]